MGFFPLSSHEKEDNVCRSLSEEITVITVRKPIQIETAFTLVLVDFDTLLMIFIAAVK